MPDEIALAIALVLVIEGGLYALFPEALKRMALRVQQVPASTLRSAGLLAATVGVAIIWFLRR